MCLAAELRAVDLSSIRQFEEGIGNSSSENGFFIPKMEFSVRTRADRTIARCAERHIVARAIEALHDLIRCDLPGGDSAQLNHRRRLSACHIAGQRPGEIRGRGGGTDRQAPNRIWRRGDLLARRKRRETTAPGWTHTDL